MDLSDYDGKAMSQWFEDNTFDFDRLDRIDIGSYYKI
jgi:hypothetical protein